MIDILQPEHCRDARLPFHGRKLVSEKYHSVVCDARPWQRQTYGYFPDNIGTEIYCLMTHALCCSDILVIKIILVIVIVSFLIIILVII